jgi:hypothetical protein
MLSADIGMLEPLAEVGASAWPNQTPFRVPQSPDGLRGTHSSYSDRRKFRRSCLSEGDRLLKFVITPLASDPQECVLAAGEKALVVPVVRGNLTVKLWLSAVSKQIVESL